MAITTSVKNVKVVLKLEEGSQTISGCSKEAANEGLYSMAVAVSGLLNQETEGITKVEEVILIEE